MNDKEYLIFDGGALKIWRRKNVTTDILHTEDCIFEIEGKDVSRNMDQLTIIFKGGECMHYYIRMYSLLDKIKKFIKGVK